MITCHLSSQRRSYSFVFFGVGIHGRVEAQKRQEVGEKADHRLYQPVGWVEPREEVGKELHVTDVKRADFQVFFFCSYEILFL